MQFFIINKTATTGMKAKIKVASLVSEIFRDPGVDRMMYHQLAKT